MTSPYSDELAFILDLCDEIDPFTLSRFESREFSIETKADLSPVTEVDRETEEKIRALKAGVRGFDFQYRFIAWRMICQQIHLAEIPVKA